MSDRGFPQDAIISSVRQTGRRSRRRKSSTKSIEGKSQASSQDTGACSIEGPSQDNNRQNGNAYSVMLLFELLPSFDKFVELRSSYLYNKKHLVVEILVEALDQAH